MNKVGSAAVYDKSREASDVRAKNSRDVLRKLEWEQRGLKVASAQEPTELYFRAFNAAVTAWHLADWVWMDMTKAQRQQLETDWGTELNVGDDKGGNFRRELRQRNREIAICREIATASKHVEVSQSPDRTIDTVASARTSRDISDGEAVMAGKGFIVVPSWKLKVQDGSKRQDFVEIIDLVIEFWRDFIDRRGIAN